MRTVAYLRVSTNNQDLDQQRLAILDYAHRHQLTIDEFVKVKVSSRKNLRQRGIAQLLGRLDPKDVLLVSELSRLGRSVSQIIILVDRMIEKQIRFVAVKEGIDLEGAQDIQTKVMITMFAALTDAFGLRFGLFAEIERDLISERTKEGLAATRAKGKTPLRGTKQSGRPKGSFGKSKLDGRKDEIQLFLSKGVSKSAIAKIISVSRTTLRHFIKTRGLS